MVGNFILDLLLIALLAFGVYYGWKRGCIRIALKTFSGLFSAVIAASCFGKLGAVLKDKYVYAVVNKKIGEAVGNIVPEHVSPDKLTEAVPDALESAASLVGIDLEGIAESAIESGQNAVAQFTESASQGISQLIASAAAFLIIFVVSYFVLRVLSTPISALVMKIPVLGHINRFVGLLFGGLAALILGWIAIKVIGFLDESLSLSFLNVNDAWLSGLFYRYSLLS